MGMLMSMWMTVRTLKRHALFSQVEERVSSSTQRGQGTGERKSIAFPKPLLFWVIRAQVSSPLSLSKATRETSFIHAISSAGVMYTITKNCSMGDFENCGCDESKNGKTGKLCSLMWVGRSEGCRATFRLRSSRKRWRHFPPTPRY